MVEYEPLDCDLHDYLEIACLKGYRLRILLIDGTEWVARALTTRAASREEFLVVARDSEEGGVEQCEIRLDRIRSIAPVDSGADFGIVHFKNP